MQEMTTRIDRIEDVMRYPADPEKGTYDELIRKNGLFKELVSRRQLEKQ